MAKKKRKKTPSRIKYDRNNPVSSSRVDKKLKETLREIKEKEGLSQTDILRRGAGLVVVKMRKEEELRLQGHDEGYEQAANTAYELWAVPYPCSICGEEIVVTTDEEKKAIATYMREHGWGHSGCINRRD